VEKSQYELCIEVLRRLDRAGVLKHIVLVGSWCTLLYRGYFSSHTYAPSLKTRDIGLLIPKPWVLDSRTNLADLLKDLGFVGDLHTCHRGNLRACLRELYDAFARVP
jgi:hypothetical protein